jgi:polysaccharide export outer membrane protein
MRNGTSVWLGLVFVLSQAADAQTFQQAQQTVSVVDLNPTLNLPQQRVGPEDLLGLQVYDAPEFTRTVRVGADGAIRLPMLKSEIRVQDLLPHDIEILIAEALQREKLFVDPFVTVNVVEYHSRPISVTGSVKTPVIFQAVGKVTLLEALARGGGLSDGAGSEIIVTRPNGEGNAPLVQHIPIKKLLEGTDSDLNLKLIGGEEVRIPEVGKIVVWGNVVKSGIYPVLDSGTTVTTAIAQAEGLSQFAAHTAFIYRPDEQGVKHEIQVDLWDIEKRRKPDVELQAKDILYIPDSSGRRITSQTLDRLSGFGTSTVSGVLIYGTTRPH